MMQILLSLVLVIGVLFLGTYLLTKYGRVNQDDMNLLYAGYFSIKALIKIAEVGAVVLLGAASVQLMTGALVAILFDSIFGYFFFKRANVF